MADLPEIDPANVEEVNQLITLIGLTVHPYMVANRCRIADALRNVSIACASIAGDQSGRLDALYAAPMGKEFYHKALLANFDEGYTDAHLAMNQVIAAQVGAKH